MKGYFIKVYKDLLLIKELSLIDVLVLSILIQYQERDNECYLTTKDFMIDLHANRKQIERSFKHLKELHLIMIYKKGSKYVKLVSKSVLIDLMTNNTRKEYNEIQTILELLKQKWKKC